MKDHNNTQDKSSLVIFVCGGVGSGKSALLNLFKEEYHAKVLETDQIAHELLRIGQKGYTAYIDLLGESIVGENGELDRSKIADKIFSDLDLLQKINSILHPLVWNAVKDAVLEFRKESGILVVESALLPDASEFADLLDVRIYLHTEDSVRISRLQKERGYSKHKIEAIMKSQPDFKEYMAYCDLCMENSNDVKALREALRGCMEGIMEAARTDQRDIV